MSAPDPRAVVVAACRQEWPALVAAMVRLVGDVGLAEELAQEALLSALEAWPRSGLPDRPGAWLVTTARNRGLNAIKRRKMADRTVTDAPLPVDLAPDVDARLDEGVGDDVLRLLFTACHPVLSREARVALALRLVAGLTTAEIARAWLVPEATVAQRLVRAKRTLAEAGVPFDVPREELPGRLSSVLEVVYLVFNEGYLAHRGDALVRLALVDEALRLGRLLVDLAPAEPEARGLLALMAIGASRIPARTDATGDPVLLDAQDRSRWDTELAATGLSALDRGERLAREPGPLLLQAAIAACHARAATAADTDWPRIAELYGRLLARTPSPVVALNRAVAVWRAEGPLAGLALLDALAAEPALARYPQLPGARAEMLLAAGRPSEAAAAFREAAARADNDRLRKRLLTRADACGDG